MKWRNTRIFSVKIPLLKPIPVKDKRLLTRDILRVEQETWDGRKAWAECSPLPGFHEESIGECLAAAKEYFALPAFAAQPLPVSLQTAIDVLEWQLDLPEAGVFSDSFENSALLTLPDPTDFNFMIDSVSEARVCKVKVPSQDLTLARRFLEALAKDRPDRELRVDCNQALERCGLDEVVSLLRGLPVAYIEEPFSDLAKLKEIAGQLPIALDESLGLDDELDRAAKAWVIKPNVVGWERSLARFAHPGPQAKILSNTFESHATLQLYAWAYRQAVKRPEACGLGTAFYMAEDVESFAWDPKTYRSAWPLAPIADYGHRGELVWEN